MNGDFCADGAEFLFLNRVPYIYVNCKKKTPELTSLSLNQYFTNYDFRLINRLPNGRVKDMYIGDVAAGPYNPV